MASKDTAYFNLTVKKAKPLPKQVTVLLFVKWSTSLITACSDIIIIEQRHPKSHLLSYLDFSFWAMTYITHEGIFSKIFSTRNPAIPYN
ncbi:hypothetical protein [Lentibacillus sp. Marseille-P4043]|uniref:hypothetical protein n=1 Tax=Lentibacillus sp. Marseille-P4043 TaxID=2040293 RepID=UPI000D0B195F|nr:hypothetical protein [Lentibacillus sp. Marseille-P4043]